MNKTTKKALSLVLMIIMMLSSVPMTSFAAWCDVIGHDVKWVETTPATCTAGGVETEKCARDGCTYTTGKTRTTSVKSHTIQTIAATAPTCDKPGNKEGQYCSTCDLVIKECETIPAIGHTPVNFEAKEATCTENGRTAGTECSVCKKILTGGITQVATGHNLKLASFKAGSCTEEGWEIWECKTCGEESTKTVAAEHNFSGWTTVAQATCTAVGKMTRACRECGVTESKTIDMLSHTEVIISATAATCTEPGTKAGKKCTVCNGIIEGCQVIPALGHTEVVVKGTAAGCGTKGISDGAYCSVCKTIIRDQVEIAAREHNFAIDKAASVAATCTSEGKTVEKCQYIDCGFTKETIVPKTHEVNWTVNKEATCTEAGKRSGYCTACKKTVVETIEPLGHLVTNALSWHVKTPATCTKDGERVAACSRCAKQASEPIPATGHDEVVRSAAKDPTCAEEGATESKQCTICKEITVKAETIAKLPHTFGEWTETKTATCKVAGVREAVCSECGAKEHETIDRLPHTEEITPAVEATCTTAGSTRGSVCTVCKDVLEKVTPIDALGHDYIKDEAQCKEPDCTNEGKFYGTCSRCGDIKDEVIPAKGHDEEVEPGTPADCTLGGTSDFKKCKVCGVITAEPQQIPALGHDFVVDTATSKPATCTENGYEYLNCSRCKATDQRETPALDHAYGDWEVTLQPTCDKQGEKTRICVNCNNADIEKIESLGSHNVVTLPGEDATCTTEGKTTGMYCDKCNTIFEAQEVIPALGHDIDGVEPTLTKATFKKDGSYAIRCERADCGELVDPQVIARIDEKSIKLSTAKCTYNGKKRTPSVTVKDVNGEPLEKGTDFDVKYDSGRKAVGEYKITVTFKGNYEGKKVLIFTIAPGKTSKVSATSSQKDYVKISWKAVEGATGYRVYVYETVEGKTRKKVASVTGTSYNLKKDYLGDTMAVGAQYKVAVTAYTKLEDDTVIHALAGVAKTFTRTPGKPSLTVTSASGKANLKWTNVDDETGYQVYYATSKDGEYKKATSTATNTFSKAYTKGKTIYFKVRAYTKVDGEVVYGSFSTVESVKIK